MLLCGFYLQKMTPEAQVNFNSLLYIRSFFGETICRYSENC